MPFPSGVPPAARWAAALRPRTESVHPRGGELLDCPSVPCGCWRADPDVRQAARRATSARGRVAISLPAPVPPARPVLPFQPAAPLAPRWAAAMRPRAGSGHPRGGADHDDAFGGVIAAPASPFAARRHSRRHARCAVGGGHADRAGRERPSERRTRLAPPMHQIRDGHAYSAHGLLRGSKLVDGSAVSCGCRRADPDVRQAARMTMPARGRMANRCPAPLPAARPNQSCRFRPASRPLRGGRRPCDRGPRARCTTIRGGHAYGPTIRDWGAEGVVRGSKLLDGSAVSLRLPGGPI